MKWTSAENCFKGYTIRRGIHNCCNLGGQLKRLKYCPLSKDYSARWLGTTTRRNLMNNVSMRRQGFNSYLDKMFSPLQITVLQIFRFNLLLDLQTVLVKLGMFLVSLKRIFSNKKGKYKTMLIMFNNLVHNLRWFPPPEVYHDPVK